MPPGSAQRRRHVIAYLFASAALLLGSQASAASDKIKVIGSPKIIKFDREGYAIDPDSGQAFDITGPANILLQIWSTTPTARVVITLVADEEKVSTNVVRFRHMPVNRKDGMEYLTLLAFKAFPDTHRYRIKVSGTQVAVVPSVGRTFSRQFAAARWKETDAQSAAAAATPPPSDTDESTGETTVKPEETLPTEPAQDIPVAAASPADEDFGMSFPNDEGGATDLQLVATKRLDAADHILDIGGTMFLRARYFHYQGGSLSSDTITSPNLTDIYFDANPNEALRGYARARLKFDPTKTTNPAQLLVNQLWFKATMFKTLFVTFGQQPMKWGTGRFHNPTDFMNRQQRDPFTLFDERNGIPLLKLHLPLETLGWNLYAIASYGGAGAPNKVGGAARAEIVLGRAEFALTAAARYHERPRFGFDFSATAAFIDFFAEAAVRQGGQTPFYRGTYDPTNAVVPETYTKSEQWLPQVAGGFEVTIDYSDEDRLRLGTEYFYNALGYNNSNQYAYQLAQGTYLPFYEGRHYAGVYATLPSPGPLADVTFLVNTIGNLSDRSWLSWIDTRYLVMNVLTVTFLVNLHWGHQGEFKLGLGAPTARDPGVSAATYNGVPYLDFQLGLLMNI